MNWLRRLFKGGKDNTGEDYDAISSVVYRRLDREVSILAGDAALDQSAERLREMREWAKNLPRGATRRAYLFWIPYFEESIARYKGYNDSARRIEKVRGSVPSPPTR